MRNPEEFENYVIEKGKHALLQRKKRRRMAGGCAAAAVLLVCMGVYRMALEPGSSEKAAGSAPPENAECAPAETTSPAAGAVTANPPAFQEALENRKTMCKMPEQVEIQVSHTGESIVFQKSSGEDSRIESICTWLLANGGGEDTQQKPESLPDYRIRFIYGTEQKGLIQEAEIWNSGCISLEPGIVRELTDWQEDQWRALYSD